MEDDTQGMDLGTLDLNNPSRGGHQENNTENSVNHGNVEMVMKGQYSDAVPDLMEDHSHKMLPRQKIVEQQQERARKYTFNRHFISM